MKKIGLILCFFLTASLLAAQETYTVQGETLQLKTEVEGKLDLLWNIIDGRYRYFVRTPDNSITELVNTKIGKHNFLREYQNTLVKLTNRSAFRVHFNLGDLKVFIDDYNASQDPNYERFTNKDNLKLLLEVFGGITNSPFIDNPDNTIAPQFGAILEVDAKQITRHALFMQLRHVFKTNQFKYTTTELALGYRFRVVNSRTLKLFAQTKFATLNFDKNTVPGPNDVPVDISETTFDIPFTFGVGADVLLTEQSFFTIRYNELFSALLENNGHFSTNITLGYKFNL